MSSPEGKRFSPPSFEESLRLAEGLIQRLENSEMIETELRSLLSTVNGARGFFVVLLTGPWKVADNPPPYLVQEINDGPDHLMELLTKNIVMSTTMALTHKRNGDLEGQRGSELVARRTAQLIRRMEKEKVSEHLSEMLKALCGSGTRYATFLKRWRFDAEQLEKAKLALNEVMS